MPHSHKFDPGSGWCIHCPLRDDGRLVDSARKTAGRVLRPGLTPEELHEQMKETT